MHSAVDGRRKAPSFDALCTTPTLSSAAAAISAGGQIDIESALDPSMPSRSIQNSRSFSVGSGRLPPRHVGHTG
jgi:hypothetical protein